MSDAAYHREYWRKNIAVRRLQGRQAYRRIMETDPERIRRRARAYNEWCLAVCGVPHDKLRHIRKFLREQAAQTGEDFLEMAQRANVLTKTERKRLGLPV